MTIRRAILSDAVDIGHLLSQLGYRVSVDVVQRQLATLLDDADEDLLVGETDDKKIIAFLSMHYIPQIAMEGGFARISYLCVDKHARFKGMGKELEREACRLASQRGCDRMEPHCHSRRTDAHRFYARRGYMESPKYFLKKLPKPGEQTV